MPNIRDYLLSKHSTTYSSYYAGKMSYKLHGKSWEDYVRDTFPDIGSLMTSENIFKTAIDLYAENLVPTPDELRPLQDTVIPLLIRGEAPLLVDAAGELHCPEHYEMISDSRYTVCAIFTRSLEQMEDYVTFAYSDGHTELWSKQVPRDLTPADREGYQFVETTYGNRLFRLALDDTGMGGSLAALQDRVNHSILDQTVIAEMYARPFWYLLNVDLPPNNPYLPRSSGDKDHVMREQRNSGAGRIFTTSGEGPFGQLNPPTIGDMVAYHDSIIDKLSQNTGIPQHYFKPGQSAPPTGIALRVLSRRFNNKVARIRSSMEPILEEIVELLGIQPEEGSDEVQLWPSDDDLLQDTIDTHGLALVQMGYPLDYVASVVTPGVDLDQYEDDGMKMVARMAAPQPTEEEVES